MAKRLATSSKEAQLVVIGKRASFKVPRVQRFNLGTDIPSTTVVEIGSASNVGESKDTPNVTLTFSAFDVGIKTWATFTGYDPAAYPAAGVDIVNVGEVDAAVYVKSDTVSDYAKTAHARRLQVRDFSFNYSVDGESTEDYNLSGSERRWLKYDVVVDAFSTGTTTFTLTQTPRQLLNGHYAMSVIVNGVYMDEVTGVPATGEYRIVGTTLTTGDARTASVVAVYHADPAGNNWADVAETTLPTAIRGNNVPVSIAANSVKRVQSVTINGSLNPSNVKEMGNRVMVGYQRQNPTVEGSITVLDTDTELVNLFENGEVLTSGVEEWMPGEGCAVSGISLKVELLDPCDTTTPYTVLKTVYLDDIAIVGDSYSLNVNGNAATTYNFKSNTGHLVVYEGSM